MREESQTYQPLGPAKPRPQPTPRPEWENTDTPHIERNTRDGTLRNVAPTPPGSALPCPYYGSPETWGAQIDALRRLK